MAAPLQQSPENRKTERFATVDVVIPVYNGQQFILQALASVVQQTCAPQKIIVVDDGSTDNTAALVRGFASPVPLEYVKQSHGGLSSARNAGIARCTGTYVAFLDADDEWYPGKLAEQLRIMQNTDLPDLGVVYCKYTIIDEKGDPTDSYYVFELDTTVRGNVFSKLQDSNKIASSGSGVMVRRDCFKIVGGFDERLSAYEDWDMWLRLAERYDFDFSYEPLVKIRRHAANMQWSSSHMLVNQLHFYQKWLARLPADAACYSRWRLDIAYRFVTDWQGASVIGPVTQILSKEERRALFGRTFGSFRLYLVGAIPWIAARFIGKRAKHAWNKLLYKARIRRSVMHRRKGQL